MLILAFQARATSILRAKHRMTTHILCCGEACWQRLNISLSSYHLLHHRTYAVINCPGYGCLSLRLNMQAELESMGLAKLPWVCAYVNAYVPFYFGDDGRVGATGPLWMHSFGREEGYYGVRG
jgi:hypothetical protein